MAFAEFTLDIALKTLGATLTETDLFPLLVDGLVPAWLPDWLARGTRLALISEKARSEFIVVPILLAAKELSGGRLAIFSGQRLDVDASRGLTGECDFLLAIGASVPPLRAPIAAVVGSKKNDVEGGLGQCVAQLVAAREFNLAEGDRVGSVYGCVTTGESWQFLRLSEGVAELDNRRFYLDNPAGILGAFSEIVGVADL